MPIEQSLTCYRKSGSPERMAGSDFDRKLLSGRFSARAEKMWLYLKRCRISIRPL